MTTLEPLVELSGVSRDYGSPGDALFVRALDHVDLAIGRSEYCAITGESGSGKTTCLHLLALLDRPTAGSVSITGRNHATLTRAEAARLRAKSIGIVFQGANLIESLSVSANLMLAAQYAGVDAVSAKQRAQALLERVGLHDRAAHRPQQLSGGQQQRVAIARALMNRPALLLADEPTAELDVKNTGIILDIFDELHRTEGQTIVVITHNPAVWARAERVIRLSDGRIVEDTRRHA